MLSEILCQKILPGQRTEHIAVIAQNFKFQKKYCTYGFSSSQASRLQSKCFQNINQKTQWMCAPAGLLTEPWVRSRVRAPDGQILFLGICSVSELLRELLAMCIIDAWTQHRVV